MVGRGEHGQNSGASTAQEIRQRPRNADCALRTMPSRHLGDDWRASRLEETVMRATIQGVLISALVMSVSGAVFAQGTGGGGRGGTAGGAGGGQGGTGRSTPNSNGVTGSASSALGSSTMGNSSDMSHKKMQKKGATGASDTGSY